MKTLSMVTLVVLCCCAVSIVGAQPAADRVAQLMREGDEYATKTFENQKALEKFLEAEQLAPNNDEVLWRISRSYIDIGEHMPATNDEQKNQQLAVYEKALAYAEKAAAANPKSSMAFTRKAIAKGRIALFRGIWESLDLVKQTKADLETALKLNPTNETALYVLGRTHAKVSERPRMFRWPLGLGWANMEEAIKNYEKSIALRPDFIMYRLDCARAYIEEEEYEKARTHLNIIATLPTLDEDDDRFRQEAKELLEQIKGE